MANSWLHTGSLVCPACQDICGEQFAKQGQRCKPGVLPPKNHVYYEESLPCSAPSHFHTSLSTVLLICCSLIILSFRIALWDKNKLWLLLFLLLPPSLFLFNHFWICLILHSNAKLVNSYFCKNISQKIQYVDQLLLI